MHCWFSMGNHDSSQGWNSGTVLSWFWAERFMLTMNVESFGQVKAKRLLLTTTNTINKTKWGLAKAYIESTCELKDLILTSSANQLKAFFIFESTVKCKRRQTFSGNLFCDLKYEENQEHQRLRAVKRSTVHNSKVTQIISTVLLMIFVILRTIQLQISAW